MADIAVLGLELDATGLVKGSSGGKEALSGLTGAAYQAEKATTSLNAATAKAAEVSRMAAQAEKEWQQQQGMRAQTAAANAAVAARATATAMAAALEQQFMLDSARIKDAQARGFMTGAEAQQAGREAALEFNAGMVRQLDQLSAVGVTARTDPKMFTELAGSLKNVDEAARSSGLGMGRLNDSMAMVMRQTLNLNPAAARMVDTLGTFAIGTAYMVPVMAGLAAIGLAWTKMTEESRKAREELERARKLLADIKREQDLGVTGETGVAVAAAQRRLEEILREVERLRAAGPTGDTEAQRLVWQGRIKQLRDDYTEIEAEVKAGEKAIADAELRAKKEAWDRVLQLRDEIAASNKQAGDEALAALKSRLQAEQAALLASWNSRSSMETSERQAAAQRAKTAEGTVAGWFELDPEMLARWQEAQRLIREGFIDVFTLTPQAKSDAEGVAWAYVDAIEEIKQARAGLDMRGAIGSSVGSEIGGTAGTFISAAFTGGATAIVSAMIGALGHLFRGDDTAARQEAARREAEQRAQAAKDFREAVDNFAKAVGGTPATIGEGAEKLLGINVEDAKSRQEEIRRKQAELEGVGGWDIFSAAYQRAIAEWQALEIEYEKQAEILAIYNQRIAEVTAAYQGELEVRSLVARGMEEEAAKRRIEIDQAREYAEAVAAGWDEATLAMLKLVQGEELAKYLQDLADAAEDLADAAAEAAKRVAEATRALVEDLAVRGLRLTGRGAAADTLALTLRQRDEREAAAGESSDVLAFMDLVHELERGELAAQQAIAAVQDGLELQLAALEAQASAARDAFEKQDAAYADQIELAEAALRVTEKMYDDQIKVAEDQLRVAEDQLRTQEKTVEELRSVVTSLSDYRQSLLTSNLSTLSPVQQLEAARGEFLKLAGQAYGGSITAGQALPGAAQTFLEASRGVNASGAGYQSDWAAVHNVLYTVEGRFGTQLSVEEQMLSALQTQVGQLESQIDELQRARSTAVDAAQNQIDELQRAREAARDQYESQIAALEEQMRVAQAAANAQIAAIRAAADEAARQAQHQIDLLLRILLNGVDLRDRIYYWGRNYGFHDPNGPGLPPEAETVYDYKPDLATINESVQSQGRATIGVLQAGFQALSDEVSDLRAEVIGLRSDARRGLEMVTPE